MDLDAFDHTASDLVRRTAGQAAPAGDEIAGQAPTYRGEGRTFL